MFVFLFIEVRFVLETILLATPKNLRTGNTIKEGSNRPEAPLSTGFQVWTGP